MPHPPRQSNAFLYFFIYWCIGALVLLCRSDQDLRDKATSASAATFVTTLVFNAIIFGAGPGTFILTGRERVLFLPSGIFFTLKDCTIKDAVGMDS